MPVATRVDMTGGLVHHHSADEDENIPIPGSKQVRFNMPRRSTLAFPELQLILDDTNTNNGDGDGDGDGGGGGGEKYDKRPTLNRNSLLTHSVRLKISEASRNRAAYAMLFAVFADSVNNMCTFPNHPVMCSPGASEDSFPSVEPFGITTALYVLNGAGSVGIVISSLFFGWLTTKIGCRKCTLLLMICSAIFTTAKYFARGSYWAFVVLSFINALFGSSIAIGSGYMALLFKGDRMKIDAQIGYVMATMAISRPLGGLLTVMLPSGLFDPLIPAVVISTIAIFVVHAFVLEPSLGTANDESDDQDDSPKTLDKCVFTNIIVGAFIDNVGSLGLIPFTFSPVFYIKFYRDFELQGLEPIMSLNEYRYLYSMIALTAIPGALMMPVLYDRVGVALTSVLANFATGITLLGLAFAALYSPTEGNFILSMSILYIGCPLSVISNLSTSPMLDRVSPVKMKTFVLGLNSSIYDGTQAVFLILFGLISDSHGYMLVLWICVGVQALATLANLPLVFNPLLGRQPSVSGEESGIDEDEIQALLDKGEYVPIKDQYTVNKRRADRGEPYLKVRYGKYTKDEIEVLRKMTTEDLEFVRNAARGRLTVLYQNNKAKEQYLETVHTTRTDIEEISAMKQEMGEWITEYLYNNGYLIGFENPQIFKFLFINSFPQIIDGTEMTIENVEDALIQSANLLNRYVEISEGYKRRSLLKKLK